MMDDRSLEWSGDLMKGLCSTFTVWEGKAA